MLNSIRKRQKSILAILLAIPLSGPVWAGEADVTEVKVVQTSKGVYRFDVTVKHADEGWKHYADRWEILGPDNTVLGVRTLAHPHVHEQPFTRSLSGVKIPSDIAVVTVRSRDSVHGFGGAELRVKVPH